MKLAATVLLLLFTFNHAQGQPEGFLRLVDQFGNTGGSSGRLEIYHDQRWGTICDDDFGFDEALVACRQLGLSYFGGGYGNVQTQGYPEGSHIWLNGAACSGLEIRLDRCSLDGFGVHSCQHFEDIVVFCDSTPVNGALQIVSDSGTGDFNDAVTGGRLEIYFSGEWGGICDPDFSITDATVACRQLGYDALISTGAVSTLGFTSGGNPLLDVVSCIGNEQRLFDCPYNGFGFQNCIGKSERGVVCGHPVAATPQPATVRLVGVTGHTRGAAGRVEVFYNSEWLTLRSDPDSDQVARVVCDQLGYSNYLYYGGTSDLTYTQGITSSVTVLAASCSRTHNTIQDCSLTPTAASFRDDLVVFCNPVPKDDGTPQAINGDLRLNVSNDRKIVRTYSGRLEMFLNGQWGTVCSYSFSESVAHRVCRELGYRHALYFGTAEDLRFGQGTGPIWVDDIRCDSDDSTAFLDCTSFVGRSETCPHEQDMGLVCVGEGSLRFSANGGEDAHIFTDTGRLEVYANSRWGTVCDDGFNAVDANLACRQLGFNNANSFGDAGITISYDTTLDILLDDVDCQATPVDFLLRCIHIGIGSHNCGHHEDIVLECEAGSNVGLIVGVSLGVGLPLLIAVVACCLCCCCCYCCSSKKTSSTVPANSYPMQQTTTQTNQVHVSQPAKNPNYPPQQPGAYPSQQYTSYPTAPQQYIYPANAPYPTTAHAQYPQPTAAHAQYPQAAQANVYVSTAQQPPAPYSTARQDPPPSYSDIQQHPTAYPAQGYTAP